MADPTTPGSPRVEVRSATAEEMPSVAAQASRQLGIPPASFGGMTPEWTTCVFVDGEVATTYAAWPLQIRFNGPAVPIQGVTWVSTHPAHRRRGYLRMVARHHFEQMRERRQEAIAALHPAWMAIYGRYGYASITTRTTYTVAPRDIQWRHPVEVPGRVREVDLATEFGLLVEVYRRYREERNGLVHRGRAMWDSGPTATPPPGQQQVVLAYEEDGDPVGYVVYHHGPMPGNRERAGAGQSLEVTDMFAMTPAAHQALWSVLGGYDNVAEIRRPNASPDDPLPHMLVEPRMLNARTADGIMARLVNVEDALPLRPYSAKADLRFELVDSFCEWNAGKWTLSTSLGGSDISREDGPVDLRLGVDTLAQLAFGRLSATQAAAAGLLEDVRDAAVLDRWDAAFRTKYPPHEAEHTW
ncbi:MAG: GNAT family N-acetyltransferase [Dehalococcoidia bacterium]|nr:GNAT family N-acetyltransferase [Dehalococcoidia bacterium]